MNAGRIRIVPLDDGWVVLSGVGYYAIPPTKEEAVKHALILSKTTGKAVFIKNGEGKFEKINSN